MTHATPQIYWRMHCSGVRAFVRSLETFPRLPRMRKRWSLLCRCGLHRWGAWDIRLGDWRVIERKCRRCGVVSVRRFGGNTPA